MGMFSFFGDQEHKVFDYKPIYYDKDEEERKRMFGHVDGSAPKDGEGYVPGSYIKGSWRDGNYRKARSASGKVSNIIGLVALLLIVAVLLLIAKFYSLL